jgi:hypothetical protein
VSTADCLWARMEGGAPPASPASVVRAALAAPVAAVAYVGATRSTSRGRRKIFLRCPSSNPLLSWRGGEKALQQTRRQMQDNNDRLRRHGARMVHVRQNNGKSVFPKLPAYLRTRIYETTWLRNQAARSAMASAKPKLDILRQVMKKTSYVSTVPPPVPPALSAAWHCRSHSTHRCHCPLLCRSRTKVGGPSGASPSKRPL